MPDDRQEGAKRYRALTLRPDRIGPLVNEGSRFYPERNYWRPKTRKDCSQVPRPCPYVACKWNLYLDVMENGAIKLNRPDIDPGDMKESCVLDAAEQGGLGLEEVGALMNVTGERIRQLEVKLLEILRELPDIRELLDAWYSEGPEPCIELLLDLYREALRRGD